MANNEIFGHTDDDADRLYVGPNTREGLRFRVKEENESSNVDLDAAAVSRLHVALGQWLHRNDEPRAVANPDAPTLTLGDADAIRTLAREEFEKLFNDRTRPAVLPLWESPVSSAVFRLCPGCSEEVPTVDSDAECTCTHLKYLAHSKYGCAYFGCECTWLGSAPVPDPADVPEIMAAPRRRSAPAPIHCERCAHLYADHDDVDGCTVDYADSHQCKCTWSTG